MTADYRQIDATSEDYYAGRVLYSEIHGWQWCKYSVGFGQKGFAASKSFVTLEDAQKYFADHLAETRKAFGGTHIEREIPAEGKMLARMELQSVRKTGKPGSIIHTITLVEFDGEAHRDNLLRRKL